MNKEYSTMNIILKDYFPELIKTEEKYISIEKYINETNSRLSIKIDRILKREDKSELA